MDKISAVINPAAGCTLMTLSHDGRALLRAAQSENAVAEDPREAACYPCAPWFGRLPSVSGDHGRAHNLAATLPVCDPDHALHGHGWVQPWRVTAQADDRLSCRFDHTPSPGMFPFPFRAEQDFTVTPEGLHITLRLINTGASSMPAGVGLHPFFNRTAQTKVQFMADRLWAPPANGVEGEISALTQDLNFADKAHLPQNTVDHSFIGWSGAAEIETHSARLHLQSNAPFLHIYAPANEAFFCLEPITHLPGKFGEHHLAPGEPMELSLGIALTPDR